MDEEEFDEKWAIKEAAYGMGCMRVEGHGHMHAYELTGNSICRLKAKMVSGSATW